MKTIDVEQALLVSRLSLERCNVYLAHLSAILHLLDCKDGAMLSGETMTLLSGLEKELLNSTKSIAQIGRMPFA